MDALSAVAEAQRSAPCGMRVLIPYRHHPLLNSLSCSRNRAAVSAHSTGFDMLNTTAASSVLRPFEYTWT